MNVVEHPPTSHQQVSPPQFQNICKICKKLYKDQAGLMEHQRQQHSHSISIAQQIQRLQMNRINREVNKNGTSNDGSRVESYATLQKPPANLMKPKIQSRKQQFHSPNGESFLREENNDNQQQPAEEDWPKRTPKKDTDPPTIISGTVAAATAACYSPIPGPSGSTSNGNGPTPPTPQSTPSSPIASSPASLQMNKHQLFKSKLNPQMLSKIQQNMSSTANSVTRNQPMSPNGKAGVNNNKNPVPKLMSRAKAQYQIVRSQVSRPKISAKNATQAAPPNNEITAPPQRQAPPPHAQQNPRLAAPTLQKVGASSATRPEYNNSPDNIPPSLQKQNEGSSIARGRGGARLPPPRTIPKNCSVSPSRLTNIREQFIAGARRGNLSRGGGGGRVEVVRGRGQTAHIARRESLHSPAPSGSESDGYGYSTPSPPPPKKFRDSTSPTRGRNNINTSPNRGRGNSSTASPTRGRNNSSPPKKISPPTASPQRKKGADEERIYGKGYKCPPLDKVASYLTKKGVRIWICLVCEETEQEISRGPMICCDGCEDWYHFFCVGIEDEPPEDQKWFCKRCEYKQLTKQLTKKSVVASDSESDSASEESEPSPPTKNKTSRSPSSSPTRRGRGGGRGVGKGRGRGRGRGRK